MDTFYICDTIKKIGHTNVVQLILYTLLSENRLLKLLYKDGVVSNIDTNKIKLETPKVDSSYLFYIFNTLEIYLF